MKLSCPHGKGLIGAATGFGASGCSARATEASNADQINMHVAIMTEERWINSIQYLRLFGLTKYHILDEEVIRCDGLFLTGWLAFQRFSRVTFV